MRSARSIVEIVGAEHTSFSGGVRKEYPNLSGYTRRDESRAAITRYAVAFFAAKLKGDALAEKQIAIRGEGVTNYIADEGEKK